MNCVHGVRVDKECRWCISGTEPSEKESKPSHGVADFGIVQQFDGWERPTPPLTTVEQAAWGQVYAAAVSAKESQPSRMADEAIIAMRERSVLTAREF